MEDIVPAKRVSRGFWGLIIRPPPEGIPPCGIETQHVPGASPSKRPRSDLVSRRARRIANARYVTLGLALTFLSMALIGAVVIRFADRKDFSSLGLALWWALQTVTTVGYGDVVPTTNVGRVVGGVEMVLGVSFISFLTATVTSTVVQRETAREDAEQRDAAERHTHSIVDALSQTREAIADLDARLDRIEGRLPG
jgi:voltage-gated potassium channel